jgi:hypothetical protein
LTLNGATGAITGTPTIAGAYPGIIETLTTTAGVAVPSAPFTITVVAKTTTVTTPVPPTSTIIPVGAPATGFGGMAGSGSSPLGLLELGGFALAAAASIVALRARRQHARRSSNNNTHS